MEDQLPDFTGMETPAPEAATEAEQPQAVETPQEAAPAPEPQPEAEPAVVDPATGQPVPLATFLDMRDRATAAEREARTLREWRQQQEEAARRQQEIPDRTEDPEGYEAHREAAQREQFRVMYRNASKRFATLEHGQDAVTAAEKWYDEQGRHDPFFNQKVWTSEDPYGVVLAEWQRSQLLSKVDPTDYDAFLAWKRQQAGQAPAQPQPAAGAPAAPPARPAAPRPSIAAAPSAGASSDPAVKNGDETYREMFG